MKKNNFLIYLNTLKPKEVRKFERYLKGTYPYSTVFLKIADYYIKFYKKKKSPPALEIVHNEIFKKPAQTKNDTLNLQNGLSDLFLRLKDYLIQQKILATTFEKEFLWLQILEERGLSHQNNLHLQKLKKTKKGVQNIWKSVDELKVYHYEFFRNDFQKNTPDIDSLQKGVESLEEFYNSVKLKFAAEIINRKKLLPQQSLHPKLETFINNLETTNLQDLSKNSELYLTLIKFLLNQTIDEYALLKKYLKKNHHKLHQDEKLTIIIYMENYLAKRIRGGDSKMMKEAFELYKFGLDKKILIRNDKLGATPFYNIVNTACYLKKYPWAKQFIKDYKIFLQEEIREEAASLALIVILFKEKKYKDILTAYHKIKLKNALFKISGTIHFLASIYELGDHYQLITPLDTFTRFLNSNKTIGKDNKNAALNFVKILKYLMRQRLSKNQIEEDIQKQKLIFFRMWLADKASSYKQR